jgi:hypothetical protein
VTPERDLDTSFVLVEGDWSRARAARLVRHLGADWVVVHVRTGRESRYDAFARDHAAFVLEQGQGETVADALLGHPSLLGVGPHVVVRRGRVVGLETPLEDAPSATRGTESVGIDLLGAPGGAALPQSGGTHDAAAAPEPVSRAVAVGAPSQVGLGQRAWVVVRLIADMTAPGTVPVSTAVGESIGIVVQASATLEIDGASDGELTVTAAGAPALRFRLLGRTVGPGDVTVYVFLGQQGVGSVTVPVEVVAQGEEIVGEPSTMRIDPPLYRAPDLQLLVLEGRSGYTLRLTAADLDQGLNLAPFGPFELQPEPKQFFQDFYGDIQQILVADATAKQKLYRLASKGNYLFDRLLPPPARAHLWKLRGRIRSVHIQSEEPWIPWELLKLSGDDGAGAIAEGGFLCEEFEVTRWIPGLPYRADLALANIGVVAPADAGLAAAPAERQALLALQTPTRQVTEIEAEEVALRDALKSGAYDGLHFTGHGLAAADNADRAEIRLEEGSRLRPEDLTGVVANLGRGRPLVFLNACQIGRAGMGLTGPGGWPRGFLGAGAGAFVGPYWNVIDASAAVFAREFYRGLLAGATVGKAALDARLQIKAASDPTWLAYSVYSHASACVR